MDYFLIVVEIVALLVAYICICGKMANIAHEKGHNDVRTWHIVLLGIPYMIAIASLPDLVVRQKCDEIIKNGNLGASMPVSNSVQNNYLQNTKVAKISTSMWKCPQCGTQNAVYVGTCSCGTRKPRN